MGLNTFGTKQGKGSPHRKLNYVWRWDRDALLSFLFWLRAWAWSAQLWVKQGVEVGVEVALEQTVDLKFELSSHILRSMFLYLVMEEVGGLW